MLRSAEKILDSYYPNLGGELKFFAIKAINEARKEAIEECAGRATVSMYDYKRGEPIGTVNMGQEVDLGAEGYVSVDKQSILSLLNELK